MVFTNLTDPDQNQTNTNNPTTSIINQQPANPTMPITMNQTLTHADRIYSIEQPRGCVSPRSVRNVNESACMQEPSKPTPLSPPIVSNMKSSFMDLIDQFVSITQDDAEKAAEALAASEVIPHSPMRLPSGSVNRKSAALFFQQHTIDLDDLDDDEYVETNEVRPRRVRFQMNHDGEIDEQLGLPSFPTYELTPNLIKKCWYSKMERQAFKAEFPVKCRMLATVEYRRSAIKVAALASRSDALEILERDEVSQKALSVLVSPEARGMERAMMVLMMLPRKMMKAHSQNVVVLQNYQRNNGFTIDEMSEALAEVAGASSSSCVRMACILARGDEFEQSN
jgi:hypothetical protein